MDFSKLNPINWIKALADVLEKFDNSYFLSYIIIFALIYFLPEELKNEFGIHKYMNIFSIIAIVSLIIILARILRFVGKIFNIIYQNLLQNILARKEIKLMIDGYYPLETKLLDLLTQENLCKFESDIINRDFFADDIEQFNEELEFAYDYEDLTKYGKNLYSIYQSQPTIFDSYISRALQKLVSRKILYKDGECYCFTYAAWHYYRPWWKRIFSFLKTKLEDLKLKWKRMRKKQNSIKNKKENKIQSKEENIKVEVNNK